MFDLQHHKEYLWKYTLTYGKVKSRKGDPVHKIFPFFNIVMDPDKGIEDYHTEENKKRLFSCASIEEVFNSISDIYKDFYFLEISSLLHDSPEVYSKLLRNLIEKIGVTEYISKKNYRHLAAYADEETRAYIETKLKTS